MRQIQKILYKIRLKGTCFVNTIRNFFLRGKEPKVNIVSSLRYKNLIKEDLYLQKYLLKRGVPCKIISWEEGNDDSFGVIRSVWGYHKNLTAFKEFLDKNKTIHSKNVILENMNKEKQYHLLVSHHIPTIDTEFIEDITQLKPSSFKRVIKPVISAGGDDTHMIDSDTNLESYKDLKNWMVQPYISSISEGELSIIVIGKEIKYGIIRHPGVFSSYQKEKYVPVKEISSEVLNFVQKIQNIEEYQNTVFMRIDFVKDSDTYKVLEVELVDPDLFIEAIPDSKFKQGIYESLAEEICKKVEIDLER